MSTNHSLFRLLVDPISGLSPKELNDLFNVRVPHSGQYLAPTGWQRLQHAQHTGVRELA